jgi:hypothetical protein
MSFDPLHFATGFFESCTIPLTRPENAPSFGKNAVSRIIAYTLAGRKLSDDVQHTCGILPKVGGVLFYFFMGKSAARTCE